MEPDLLVAWPTARFDVMGPEAGIELVHGRNIAAADDPDTTRNEIRKRIEAESSAYATAGMGLIDDVILLYEFRARILVVLVRGSASHRVAFKDRIDP